MGVGGLLHDREYAIVDRDGKFINGKSTARVHSLRSKVDLENSVIAFRDEAEEIWNDFHLQEQKSEVDEYLSAFFQTPATLLQNKEGRFMDIPDIAGMTILSTESLGAIAAWFSDMDMEETRKRFRATLEISGVPAFWEDRLFLEEGTAIEFRAGDVTVFGISPRARCVVPTRHPETGEMIHGFQRSFAIKREASLPQWSTLKDYGHSYYLTVNCYIPPSESGKWISIGDKVTITGKKIRNRFTSF